MANSDTFKPPRYRSARRTHTLASLVPGATQAAFDRYGFAAAQLITEWEAIVGRDIAAVTAPERLKWPGQVDGSPTSGDVRLAPARPVRDSRHRPPARQGATLVLRVDPSRALEIDYGRARLVERVNAFFGYRAVAEIRLLQAPVNRLRTPAAPARPEARDRVALPDIGDAGLRAALESLGAGMRARRRQAAVRGAPQGLRADTRRDGQL